LRDRFLNILAGIMDDWSGWGDCTADCGSGVQTRTRSKTTEPENGGTPCQEQAETKSCNDAACNANCDLNDWSKWSLCSKACDGGHQERVKTVGKEARGLGTCDDSESMERLDFGDCNNFDCSQLVKSGRTTLLCTEMMDLIIILDGSGSLGRYGWEESQSMALKLIDAMQGGDTAVNLALMLFSGPWNYETYAKCTGVTQGDTVTAEECGISWASHFTNDTAAVRKAAKKLQWPGRTTLTSLALAEANSELIQGRDGVKSVVVVITDGKPMSPLRTGVAAAQLKKGARLVWIPVGQGVKSSIKDMKHWASVPWQDNVLEIDTFGALATPRTINKMVSQFCAQLDFDTTTTTTAGQGQGQGQAR